MFNSVGTLWHDSLIFVFTGRGEGDVSGIPSGLRWNYLKIHPPHWYPCLSTCVIWQGAFDLHSGGRNLGIAIWETFKPLEFGQLCESL